VSCEKAIVSIVFCISIWHIVTLVTLTVGLHLVRLLRLKIDSILKSFQSSYLLPRLVLLTEANNSVILSRSPESWLLSSCSSWLRGE